MASTRHSKTNARDTASARPDLGGPSLFDNNDLPIPSQELLQRKKSEAGYSEATSFTHIHDVRDKGLEAYHNWEKKSVRPAHSPLAISRGDTVEPNLVSVGYSLRRSYRHSATKTERFLPLDSISKIVTYPVVVKLLGDTFPREKQQMIRRWAAQILGEPDNGHWTTHPPRRLIFTILILTRNISLIKDFIKGGIQDKDLPLRFEYDFDGPETTTTIYTRQQENEPRHCFKHWTDDDAMPFNDRQEEVYAPFFEFPGNVPFFYIFGPKTILPFLEYEKPTDGGEGSVRRAKIHPAHHNYGDAKIKNKRYEYSAIKKLNSQDPEVHRREVEALERLGIQKSGVSHLIPLELTYKHGRDYFLVFPWADGNLKQYWEEIPDPDASDTKTALWFMNQCHGISGALRRIHHLGTKLEGQRHKRLGSESSYSIWDSKEFGRHGDIKPENILWFKNYEGRHDYLVVSDFGLTRFHNANSKSRVNRHDIDGYTNTYTPPEWYLNDEICQKYDIWSLGCVLLQFVSWLLVGANETIEDFSIKRKDEEYPDDGILVRIPEDKFHEVIKSYDDRLKSEARVKTSVTEWINKLHRHEKCSGAMHRFLDIIQFTMLVVNTKGRWSASELHRELHDLLDDCIKNHDYLVRPVVGNSRPDRFESRHSTIQASPKRPEFTQSVTYSSDPRRKPRHEDDGVYTTPRTTLMTESTIIDTEDGTSAYTTNTVSHTKTLANFEIGSQFDNIPNRQNPDISINGSRAVTPISSRERDCGILEDKTRDEAVRRHLASASLAVHDARLPVQNVSLQVTDAKESSQLLADGHDRKKEGILGWARRKMRVSRHIQ